MCRCDRIFLIDGVFERRQPRFKYKPLLHYIMLIQLIKIRLKCDQVYEGLISLSTSPERTPSSDYSYTKWILFLLWICLTRQSSPWCKKGERKKCRG